MKFKALLLLAAFEASAPASALTLNWSFVPVLDSSGSYTAIKGTVSGLVEGSNSGGIVRAFVTASPFADTLGGSYDFQYSIGSGPAFVVTGGIVTYAGAVFMHHGARLNLADTAVIRDGGLPPSLYGPADVDYAVAGTAALFTPLAGGSVPEPGSWTLLIAGFGLTGAALRRRSGLHARG